MCSNSRNCRKKWLPVSPRMGLQLKEASLTLRVALDFALSSVIFAWLSTSLTLLIVSCLISFPSCKNSSFKFCSAWMATLNCRSATLGGISVRAMKLPTNEITGNRMRHPNRMKSKQTCVLQGCSQGSYIHIYAFSSLLHSCEQLLLEECSISEEYLCFVLWCCVLNSIDTSTPHLFSFSQSMLINWQWMWNICRYKEQLKNKIQRQLSTNKKVLCDVCFTLTTVS